MDIVGIVALVLGAVLLLVFLVWFLLSIPDIARYLRLRKM